MDGPIDMMMMMVLKDRAIGSTELVLSDVWFSPTAKLIHTDKKKSNKILEKRLIAFLQILLLDVSFVE